MTIMNTDRGITERNVALHPKLSIIVPPIASPITAPPENAAEIIPWAVATLFFGNSSRIMVKAMENMDIPIP